MPFQKPNSNLTQQLSEQLSKLGERSVAYAEKAARALFSLPEDWRMRRDMAKNNFELGLWHMAQGNFGDAVFRFRMVTWIEPKNALAWYHLGRSYLGEDNKAKALDALTTSAKLSPGHEETIYLLAVAGGRKLTAGKLPRRMPVSLALEHFESLADSYDDEQLKTHQYTGHMLLATAVREALGASVGVQVLELGVGTGLCGARLRDVAQTLVGVDFSPKMLAHAARLQSDGRKTFDTLTREEAATYLAAAPSGAYDVVIACGLLSYIGDVQVLVQQASRVLRPGGIFAFTVDPCDGADYVFHPEAGRFCFPEPYLRQLASSAQMQVASLAHAEIYPRYKAWLGVFRT